MPSPQTLAMGTTDHSGAAAVAARLLHAISLGGCRVRGTRRSLARSARAPAFWVAASSHWGSHRRTTLTFPPGRSTSGCSQVNRCRSEPSCFRWFSHGAWSRLWPDCLGAAARIGRPDGCVGNLPSFLLASQSNPKTIARMPTPSWRDSSAVTEHAISQLKGET